MADSFEVDLVTSTGVVLPSLVASSGQRYVVAEPGQEFRILVRYTTSGRHTYMVKAHLDGERTGAHHTIKSHRPAGAYEFKGWLQSTGGRDSSSFYRAFKFGLCTPSSDATLATSLADIKAGRVEVQVERVVSTGRQVRCVPMVAGPSNAATSKKLPDNKKKFMAPGLKSEAGGVIQRSRQSGHQDEYKTVSKHPPIVLCYDSMEALLMRKILDPTNPAHRDILRNSSNPSMRAAVGSEAATEATAAAAAAAAGGAGSSGGGGRVKRERQHAGIKRERDNDEDADEEFVPRSVTAAKIDLTEEPAKPLVVNGRTLAADELAVRPG